MLAILLATLGALQYRWIGEISRDERERMRRGANIAAENLSREFDREVTRLFLQLQIDPITYEKKSWDNYSLRYERWRATTAYPKLVNKIFVADRNEGGAIRLAVYNETRRGFEESEWLPRFAALKSQIEQDLNAQTAAGDEKSARPPLIVAAEINALVIPISTVNLLNLDRIQTAASRGISFGKTARRVGYTIVLLDSDYIKSELLPLLVARYFNSSDDGSAARYDVTVTSRNDPSRIVYQSGSFESNEPPDSDVERDFFGLKFDEIENLLPAKTRRKPESHALETANKKERNVSVSVIVAASNKTGASDKTDSTDRINSTTAASRFENFDSRWRLVARHKNGSLDAVVEKTRRRNLVVGGGILLLLGASGVLLLALSNRSRVFARRQTDFVASVTHELRTPLAVIRSMSENLRDGIVFDDKKIRQYGALINDEERRLSAMVENILGFAGAQAAQNRTTELRPQNVRDIIEAALEDYRTELNKREFQVETVVEPELPFVMADADALRRAVGNLIGNAVKYSDRTGRVEIAARAIGGAESPRVKIVIKDAGAGIDARDLPDIFKLFYRGRQATERQIEGSGIGLSLVKQTVEAHGGTVSVASAHGQGSTFTITLPAIAADAREENLSKNE